MHIANKGKSNHCFVNHALKVGLILRPGITEVDEKTYQFFAKQISRIKDLVINPVCKDMPPVQPLPPPAGSEPTPPDSGDSGATGDDPIQDVVDDINKHLPIPLDQKKQKPPKSKKDKDVKSESEGSETEVKVEDAQIEG